GAEPFLIATSLVRQFAAGQGRAQAQLVRLGRRRPRLAAALELERAGLAPAQRRLVLQPLLLLHARLESGQSGGGAGDDRVDEVLARSRRGRLPARRGPLLLRLRAGGGDD